MKDITNYWWFWLGLSALFGLYICFRQWPIWKTLYWKDTGQDLIKLWKARFPDCTVAGFFAALFFACFILTTLGRMPH